MKVKEESEKVGLKLNTQKTKIVASGPITSWQIDGKTMETVRDFIFLGSKITADDDCSRKIKRCLLLWKKVMTNLESILKSRYITLLTKLCLVKAIVFPVLMYGCENWTIKKAEHQRTIFLNCGVGEESWESLGLQGDPTYPNPKGNQSWIFIEGLTLQLKLLYFGHLMQRTDSLLKNLMLRKIEGEGDNRGWDDWMASLTRWIWVWASARIWSWTGKPCVLLSLGSQRVGHDWVTKVNW